MSNDVKAIKFTLKNFDIVIYTEEHIQEVRYRYTIEDSTGLLEIYLTIPEEADPVEYFVLHIKDLYKYNIPVDYIVYHTKWKYILRYYHSKSIRGYQLLKRKMY